MASWSSEEGVARGSRMGPGDVKRGGTWGSRAAGAAWVVAAEAMARRRLNWTLGADRTGLMRCLMCWRAWRSLVLGLRGEGGRGVSGGAAG